MSFESQQTYHELRAELNVRATERWNSPPAEDLAAALDMLATSLCRLKENPLDFLDVEPDFVAGTLPTEPERSRD